MKVSWQNVPYDKWHVHYRIIYTEWQTPNPQTNTTSAMEARHSGLTYPLSSVHYLHGVDGMHTQPLL